MKKNNRFKKYVSLCISIILILAFSTSALANQTEDQKVAKLKKEIEEVAKKHGGTVIFYDNVNDAKQIDEKLKFKDVKEFEKALDSIVIETTEVKVPETSYQTTSTKVVTLVKDHNVYVPIVDSWAGTLRHKMFANMSYNSTAKKWYFSSLESQQSYIYGASACATWSQDGAWKGITDSARTAWGKINGHFTLSVAIDNVGVGYTWDEEFYDEWGYSQYQ